LCGAIVAKPQLFAFAFTIAQITLDLGVKSSPQILPALCRNGNRPDMAAFPSRVRDHPHMPAGVSPPISVVDGAYGCCFELADVLFITADFDCSRSGSFRTVLGVRLCLLFAVECGLQLPWRKHYSVLDFLTSSAFIGTNIETLLPDCQHPPAIAGSAGNRNSSDSKMPYCLRLRTKRSLCDDQFDRTPRFTRC
jgi:hypothetical protein